MEQRVRDKANYSKDKLSGICVRHGCKEVADAGVFCGAHRQPSHPYTDKRAEINWYCSIKKFGWTRDVVDKVLQAQNNRCAICGAASKQRLDFDHDHVTLRPREFLCRRCNMVLGHVEDNVELLQQMILYLNKHGEGG